MKFILPNPFNLSVYGLDNGQAYKDILNLQGANPNASEFLPSNQINDNCTILEPIPVDLSGVDISNPLDHVKGAKRMQENVIKELKKSINDFKNSQIFVIGGDHTISIGTGAYLSTQVDMSKVGLLWIDAHGDFNTPQSSPSKSLTGYPCAINNGIGEQQLLEVYKNNHISKIVQVGIRDIDELESQNLKERGVITYSNIDVVHYGLKYIIEKTQDHFDDCDFIWLSIDIDSLDPIYCDNGRTDVPVVGGLTPRELIYITDIIHRTGKLKVTELVQINNSSNNSNLTYLANRLIELAFGLGKFRTNN